MSATGVDEVTDQNRSIARTKIAALVLGFGLAVLSTGHAEARLLSANLPAPTESKHQAVHLPTGCKANVVLDHTDFISASITDPDCLPRGIYARRVPGSMKDFRLLPLPTRR